MSEGAIEETSAIAELVTGGVKSDERSDKDGWKEGGSAAREWYIAGAPFHLRSG